MILEFLGHCLSLCKGTCEVMRGREAGGSEQVTGSCDDQRRSAGRESVSGIHYVRRRNLATHLEMTGLPETSRNQRDCLNEAPKHCL